MDEFGARVRSEAGDVLRCAGIETLQVNVGLRCNQRCAHCHLNCSSERTEAMDWPTMEAVVRAAADFGCPLVDITGGAPELNPRLLRFIAALREGGRPVQVRTNLTVLLEPGMEGVPAFYRAHSVRLVGSLPCYLEQNVRAQRGPGVYERSVDAIRRLNALGYGSDPDLPLDLVHNPGGPFLPPDQPALEKDYRRELGARFGITFRKLLTIANMPIGRFGAALQCDGAEEEYGRLLKDAFNPRTIGGLMCRHQVSIGWDGTLYDCDFNLALGLPVDHGAPSHIRDFEAEALATRRIVTGAHCFGCTAGAGSSCRGALA
jgi:radical SAM/Cys-rich protein